MYRVDVLSKSGAIPALSTFPRCLHTVACEVALHAPDPARTYNRTHTNPISRTDPSEHGEIASVVLADRTRLLPIVAHVLETKPQAHSASGKISRRADFAAACRGLVTYEAPDVFPGVVGSHTLGACGVCEASASLGGSTGGLPA